MEISQKRKIISLFLKAVVIISAVVGIILSAVAAKDIFMGGGRVFMYFTIQSNIAVALVELVGFVLILHNKSVGNAWFIIKLVFTVSITLTGAVFTFILAPTLGKFAWNAQNVLTHVVVPVFAVADFFVTGIYGEIKKRHVFFVVLPPFAYAIYAGVGYAFGWEFSEGANYPYFFLNWGSPAGAFGFTDKLPFMGCVWWIIALLALLLAVGFGYLAIIDKTKKRKQ
ncbi:MAG: Pr6Pr family membrane protein [Clostridia bacterium]|nr:Pr6Pr family membrane protein [Clostridia bacterium]